MIKREKERVELDKKDIKNVSGGGKDETEYIRIFEDPLRNMTMYQVIGRLAHNNGQVIYQSPCLAYAQRMDIKLNGPYTKEIYTGEDGIQRYVPKGYYRP